MEEDLKKAVEVLREGGLILYPTDTIWGIGCDPTKEESVDRIYRLKQRSDSKSMLILVESSQRLYSYVQQVPEIAFQLIDVSDRPLSIVYPGARNLAPNLIATDGSVGIRVCRDPFCTELISRFRKPLVSTSANLHGQDPPAWFGEISEEIIKGVDYVVRWRQDEQKGGKPSSVIWLGPDGSFRILRK